MIVAIYIIKNTLYDCLVKHKKLIIINNNIADEDEQNYELPSEFQRNSSTISSKFWGLIDRCSRKKLKTKKTKKKLIKCLIIL